MNASQAKYGSVKCPFCGHLIANRVKYAGQQMQCQKCTSVLTAPKRSSKVTVTPSVIRKYGAPGFPEAPSPIQSTNKKKLDWQRYLFSTVTFWPFVYFLPADEPHWWVLWIVLLLGSQAARIVIWEDKISEHEHRRQLCTSVCTSVLVGEVLFVCADLFHVFSSPSLGGWETLFNTNTPVLWFFLAGLIVFIFFSMRSLWRSGEFHTRE